MEPNIKQRFFGLLRAAETNPKLKNDLIASINALYEKWEPTLMQLNKETEENIPTFIFVYGTHGDGYNSFVCSNEIEYEELQLLRGFSGFHLPLKRISIRGNGACYIIITTDKLKKFAEQMMHECRIPMRGAGKFPYIVLKLTYEQLMRLNGDSLDKHIMRTNGKSSEKDTVESFFTENGEDIISVLKQTRSESPNESFPRISLKLNKDDISLDAKDTQIIYAIILLFKYGINVQVNKNTWDKSVRITNNGSELELSEMITLAQHLLCLIKSNEIKKEYEYNFVTEGVNNVFFRTSGSDNQIDCSEKNSDEGESSEKLQIDIAEGICTPENIKSIYDYFMKQCRYIGLLPQLNEFADKAEQGTFNKDDYKKYWEITTQGCDYRTFRMEHNNREFLYRIIKILSDLQDPNNPIVPQTIVEAKNIAEGKDPIEIIIPHIKEIFRKLNRGK